MKIYLSNKSDKRIFINLNGQQISLYPFGNGSCFVEENRVCINLTTDENYSCEKYSAKAGYYRGHRFVTQVQYDFYADGEELQLELYTERKRGDHSDSYQRVILYSRSVILPEPIYTLKNEAEIRQNLEHNKAFENKVEKRVGLLDKVSKVQDVISNILVWGFSIGLAAIVFIGIWCNFSPKAAIITFAVLGFIGFIIYRIVKKIIVGFGKTADKVFSSKTFDKAMDKANEKFEESFVYCKDMPEEIYKDESSYFDSNYISAVFRYSTRTEQ